MLAHDRRHILHFGVTAHPKVEWTAQQLREAFPWGSAPRYLLRDRDKILGKDFVHQVKARGIQYVLSAPRSSWLPQTARWSRLVKLVVFNIITNAGPLDIIHHEPALDRVPYPTRRAW